MTSVSIRRIVLFLLLSCGTLPAWAGGEDAEPTPEYLDATFSADDAARVAAGFSAAIVAVPAGNLLESMTAAADLIIRGTVASQAYRYDARDTPSTHTTFTIAQRLKGELPADEITLVQPGGPSRLDADKLMMTSTAQYFNVGEEEILFMHLDPANPIPALQATVLARFRVYENRVYDEDGYGVTVAPLGGGAYRLQLVPVRSAAERFQRINVGSHWLYRHSVDEDEGGISLDASIPPEPRGAALAGGPQGVPDSVDADTFSALIQATGAGHD